MNLTLLQKQPWLIAPEALGAMVAATKSFFDNSPDLPERPNSPCLSVEDGVGVLAITGPMLRNPDIFDRIIFGACDTGELINAVAEAAARPDIEAIFLDIDSPGGSVNGTPELAQAVADASKTKYVYAFSAGQMCSAAYWVASQADAIYATPSARIGSIGVILPVVDSSAAFEQAGLKVEVFAAGKFKSAGTPGTSLTDDQRAWLQSEVEETAADFHAAVLARGRKIPDEAMEGQTFSARKAMRFNLAGMVASRADALSRLRKLHVRSVDTGSGAMSAPSIENELAQAREQITRLESDASARDSLLTEANTKFTEATATATGLQARLEVLESERQIEAEAHVQARADLDAAKHSIASLANENSALDTNLKEIQARNAALELNFKEIEARNAALEAAEQDLEKRASLRAAQIVAETGTSAPANVTPKGEPQTTSLLEQFRAITDPGAQTTFWQNLDAKQKALILSQSNK
ncbi:MAG: S49 family peptidase [Verrucomicrobiota bacterium]